MQRRHFLQSAVAISTLGCSWDLQPAAAQDTASQAPAASQPWLRKTLKVGMIGVPGSLSDKFAAAKAAGFAGVEMNAPAVDVAAANQAAQETGLIIDGTVGNYHWEIRHTDPDPQVRAQALELLKQGIEKTAAMGADTMLLVPGHGKDGTDAEVYERAKAAIEAAIPVAKKHGVQILIENVWNDFCYDHEGGSDQTADRLAAFIDEFDPQWVGVQFDIGNHWKYGDPAAWIRTLGPRIRKLDIKGFSRAENKFTNIGAGDIDWPAVEEALREINFSGWLAAEVGGGDSRRLQEISANMERVLHCDKAVASAD
jgi:hexulose-6-phosphate isomerase